MNHPTKNYEPDLRGDHNFSWYEEQFRYLPQSDERYLVGDMGTVYRCAYEITTKSGTIRKYPKKKVKMQWQNEMRHCNLTIKGKEIRFLVARLVMFTWSNNRFWIDRMPRIWFKDENRANNIRPNVSWDVNDLMKYNDDREKLGDAYPYGPENYL